MKKRLFVLGIGICSLLSFQACKKDSKLLSPSDWVVGSWRLVLQGSDKNGDGQFSVDEKNIIDDDAVITFQFKAGSIGYRIGPNMSYVDTLSWSLVDHDHVLRLTIDDHGLSDDMYYPFTLDYTNETMLLTDTAVNPVYFRLFKREN